MDALTHTLHAYLVRLGLNPTAATPRAEHYLEHLLSLLDPADEEALTNYYGLFGCEQSSLHDVATQLGLPEEAALEHINHCVRRLAVTPEWQMLIQSNHTL